MAKLTKRQRVFAEKVVPGRALPMEEAVELLAALPAAKFRESFDVAINLGVDPRKSDQVVRGATTLPHGSGKVVRIAVFAQGEAADRAREAGADVVGFDDLSEKIKGGELDFDVVIATPDAMRIVGQLGRILGPRGLMPNPKTGTVTFDLTKAVNEAKGGKVEFRVEKAGIVHAPVGKKSFPADKLEGNVRALLAALLKAKPASAKGTYLRSVTLSTTMGCGVKIDPSSFEAVGEA